MTTPTQEHEARPINTSLRLFDLVRFMRSELHEQNLITDDEYAWLCSSEMAMSESGGSPSPRRLEDYDQLRAELATCKEKAMILDYLHEHGYLSAAHDYFVSSPDGDKLETLTTEIIKTQAMKETK